ncbi:LysR family transcriptional regulator [Enterocloster aldenensis]|jgi:LysR family transcriptional regulator, transcription activator of glutamate synthase operon|uniref:LysR family transcriptional regulator n=1 Tax=Enterocloster aldenensis TaxID=358742 RepID=UPI000E4F22CB|nr:LysR family transcriptional regulator [Enterocloster aldenensis]
MELLQLRYFCVVAKHQNMTKAAAELMISQPALSKTIAALEKELGTPLFVRRNRSIFLNRAGEILYQKIDQSINLIDDTVSEIKELSNEPFGNVRLLVLSASSYMPGFYIAFHQRYPFIKLQLSNYIRYEHMFMYDCDFCITADAGFTPLAGNCVVPILTERFVLAVQKQHPLAGRGSIHLKEAAPYPFVASNRREDLEFYCLKAGFRPNIIAECDNGTTYEAFLRGGVGISVIPEITLGSVLPEDIVCIPLTYPVIERTISLTYDSRRRMSNAGQLFLQFCMEYFQAGA